MYMRTKCLFVILNHILYIIFKPVCFTYFTIQCIIFITTNWGSFGGWYFLSKMPTTVTVIIASFFQNFILQILIVDLFLISPLLNGMLKLLY